MISQDIFSNIPAKNILNDLGENDLSYDLSKNYFQESLDTLILNSNLDNNNYIK